MKQANSSLPPIHAAALALPSSTDDSRSQASFPRRRSSVHTASHEMGKINEDLQVNDFSKRTQTTEVKRKPHGVVQTGAAKLPIRRNSIATTSDSRKAIPVIIRNNNVRLRKYSCPELRSDFNQREKLGSRTQSTAGKVNDNHDDLMVTEKDSEAKHGHRSKESKGEAVSDCLPTINHDTKQKFKGNAASRCSTLLRDPGVSSIVSESTNSLYSDSQNTFHQEMVSLLSYSGNIHRSDSCISPNPTSNRGRSSIIIWLKEINSCDS